MNAITCESTGKFIEFEVDRKKLMIEKILLWKEVLEWMSFVNVGGIGWDKEMLQFVISWDEKKIFVLWENKAWMIKIVDSVASLP